MDSYKKILKSTPTTEEAPTTTLENPNPSPNPTEFDDLPEALKLRIVTKLGSKLAARLAFVSKPWFRLIAGNNLFPKTASTAYGESLSYTGLIICLPATENSGGGITFSFTETIIAPRYGGTAIPYDGFRPLPFSPTERSLLDCRNGLLLLRNRNKTPDEYRYYVLNPYTKQCHTVIKPGESGSNTYASLAYEPSKSCFFKIVRFQGTQSLTVYESDTRTWNTLKFRLEKSVTNSAWIEQSITLKGTTYRLSSSGHLLHFIIDKVLPDPSDQARAIRLPVFQPEKKFEPGSVGVWRNRVNYMAFDKELRLWIWELGDNDEWALRNRIREHVKQSRGVRNDNEGEEESCLLPLAFHPTADTVFVGTYRKNGWSTCTSNFHEQLSPYYYHKAIPYKNHKCINWHKVVSFPLIECPVAFLSGY